MRIAPESTVLEEREEQTEESFEDFDRIEFAMSALDLVRPQKLTVALCRGRSRLRVESGRAWGRGEGERWALLSIPPTASRRSIVLALAEVAGVNGQDDLPYVLDVLLAKPSRKPQGTS
jgi:hypothetical protein